MAAMMEEESCVNISSEEVQNENEACSKARGVNGGDVPVSEMKALEVSDKMKQLVKVVKRRVECVGPTFRDYYMRLHKIDDKTKDRELSATVGAVKVNSAKEVDLNYLKTLDPKEWKEQDHYAVLGLAHLRFNASDEDIKKAYRQVVLLHHPDKRKAGGIQADNDDYFSCITKAWEILGNTQKRRSYDSVDPVFDDSIPTANESSKAKFFEVFGPVFERNARWSEKTPVPLLGEANSPREDVEHFYYFWYSFESWREYSYLDEEEKDKGQERDIRKWMDKQNKAARAKRKKEEMVRLRLLVDTAYKCDPRIQRFVQEDKEQKIAQKKARQEALRARQDEEERKKQEILEIERKKKEEQEAEEKAKQEAARKEKEILNRALKKQRKSLRNICKENNYYTVNENETLHHMASMEKMCEILKLDELKELNEKLHGQSVEEGRVFFLKWLQEVEERIERERAEVLQQAERAASRKNLPRDSAQWSLEDLQLLIKAVNFFPAGTNERWEVIANFINQHKPNNEVQRTAKDARTKAKDLQNSDYSKGILKEIANKKAFDEFEKAKKGSVSVEAVVTERFEGPGDNQEGNSAKPWTAAEQQLLEQALKTYPASCATRWDDIATCIPSRTKKECMKRYKDLVEMVKAKKAAQAAASSKPKP
ncbi:dnaJ homolog subfamily C member 2 [Hetaerina americana]|uniref:dnaJ homolog subfamily C member 2 n=1 Tax=Hetaerina americana TaxID=62018 RepID=UPI003A7F4E64